MRRFPLAGLLLALLLLASAGPPPAARAQQRTTGAAAVAPARSAAPATTVIAPPVRSAAETITVDKLKRDLYVVASDEMAGRDTPSKGLDDTAKFIAERLAALKVKPGGDDGTYFQRIELRSFKPDPANTKAELAGRALAFGTDYLVGSSVGQAEGSLLYVGHGYRIKSKNIDAYRGLDVRDKILVVAGSTLPEGVARGELTGKAGEAEWDDATSYARKNGARGLVVVPRNFERFWRFARLLMTRDSYQVSRLKEDEVQSTLPVLYPSAETLKALFSGERVSGEELLKNIMAGNPGEPFALNPQTRLTINVAANVKTATTQNVVGYLEGSHPKLKKEYVAIGAHYDHVGTGRADRTGDTIYNGADDDGSGTVATLAVAEAFARGPRPKRSILFVWHAGEEKGLWGSEYFSEFPTVPLNQIVAQLNMDMVGRSKKEGDTNPANRYLSGPNEIYVIGSREMSTELGELSERVNRSYLNLQFNYLYDDPRDPNRFFFRSDHFNYARKGIPIIFYFDGEHEDYHKPSDTPDKIDYQKMERIARTVYVTAAEIANAPRRPVVDKPLTPARAAKGY
ncbi:MAG TPA: M28 family peptidase [Pyrinomonadaceae bacterium]|nr:M28 family peptidase [Pyrinomonadaceae bacterium]